MLDEVVVELEVELDVLELLDKLVVVDELVRELVKLEVLEELEVLDELVVDVVVTAAVVFEVEETLK